MQAPRRIQRRVVLQEVLMVSIQALVSRRLNTVAVFRARSLRAVPLAPSPLSSRIAPIVAAVELAPPCVISCAPAAMSSAQRLMLDYQLAPGAALPAGLVPPARPCASGASAPVCESVGEK
jgi:hypothetical protein